MITECEYGRRSAASGPFVTPGALLPRRTKVSAPSLRFRPILDVFPAYKQGKASSAAGGRSYKLSSNESPFGPLPSVLKVIAEAAGSINRYPDNGAVELTEAIAERHDVPAAHMAVGCGSVGVAQQLLEAVGEPGAEVIYAWRSFEAYPLLSDLSGATSVRVPLRDEAHDLAAMAAAITRRTRLIFVCTPNNPTGTVVHQANWWISWAGCRRTAWSCWTRPTSSTCATPGARRAGAVPGPPERGRAADLLQGLRAGRPAGRLPGRPRAGRRRGPQNHAAPSR